MCAWRVDTPRPGGRPSDAHTEAVRKKGVNIPGRTALGLSRCAKEGDQALDALAGACHFAQPATKCAHDPCRPNGLTGAQVVDLMCRCLRAFEHTCGAEPESFDVADAARCA